MSDTTRTFIAIPMPESIERQLVRWQRSLAPQIPGCRWVETQPMHLTLAFLGEVEHRDLNALCLAVSAASEPFGRFELKVEGVGAFPNATAPRVLWAGVVADDLGPLMALRESVVAAATEAGYRPEDQRFHPHVTLGRLKAERGRFRDLSALIHRERTRSAGVFPVLEVVTYASSLGSGGPTYAPLNRGRLKGKKGEASH